MTKNESSTWSRCRLVINPSALPMHMDAHALDHEAYGLLIRALSYAAFCALPSNPKTLSRLMCLSRKQLRRLWPKIERFFVPTPDGQGWRAVPLDWAIPQLISAERRNLAWLLDALVDFWGSLCVYCGETTDLEIEHIVPLARGGTNELTNLTLSCRNCNSKKRTQTAEEFGFPDVHERAQGIVPVERARRQAGPR